MSTLHSKNNKESEAKIARHSNGTLAETMSGSRGFAMSKGAGKITTRVALYNTDFLLAFIDHPGS